ncbi:MAG: VWA domain-containing protein [Alphaproteobacteria bacterium]|nr:VWA domain-containing protein [Alphaproteobacteria bacterium]
MLKTNHSGFAHYWRRSFAGAAGSLALTIGLGVTPALASDPVRAQVLLDQPTVLAGGDSVVYVVVHFEGIDEEGGDRRDRPPLNLALVLDRSGSMSDAGKIDYLRRAAKLAVDQLGENDTLSIVEYDDQITLMRAAARVGDTSEIKRKIDELTPRGSTNLTGGMMRGVEEVRRAMDGPANRDDTITRVILMSDGLANTGITNPTEIARLVREAKHDGVRISAIGLGRDYDEDLMQAIAENGGGRYYYVESPTQIARMFQEELSTLFETCASDIQLQFHGSAAVKKVEIVGYDDAAGTRNATRVLEDVYGGEKRSVLLRLEIAAPRSGQADLGQLILNYKSAKTREAKTFSQALSVNVSSDRAAVEHARNTDATVEATLAEAERKQKAQVKLFEQGRRAEAQQNLTAMASDLEAKNRTLKDERIRRKIEALNVENRQMTTAAGSPEASAGFLKSSKQRLYQAKQGNRQLYAMRPGDTGVAVEQLQQALQRAGFYKGPIDGKYDDDVKTAVEAYQRSQHATADGVAGAATMDALGLY